MIDATKAATMTGASPTHGVSSLLQKFDIGIELVFFQNSMYVLLFSCILLETYSHIGIATH